MRALLGVRAASPSVESGLDGDGGAGRAANRQEVAVTGLLGVVPQHFGQVTCQTNKQTSKQTKKQDIRQDTDKL